MTTRSKPPQHPAARCAVRRRANPVAAVCRAAPSRDAGPRAYCHFFLPLAMARHRRGRITAYRRIHLRWTGVVCA
jgi:hypothetical protein